ncbi:MAG TPA: DNA polymerase III subunit delta, partial [Vicinamibacteria bacterium]
MAARPGKETGVHAIVGDAKAGFDSYRAEEALEGLLEAALGRDRGHALETLRGDETTWGRVLDAARTPSLFASRVAVVVRGAESIKGDSAEVEAYLEDPNPGTLLVLIAAKPDGRKAVWKRILGKAQVVKAVPLKGRELRAFVEAELRRRRLSLEPEASEALLERVGQDLRRLMGEVDKLEAFAAGEP